MFMKREVLIRENGLGIQWKVIQLTLNSQSSWKVFLYWLGNRVGEMAVLMEPSEIQACEPELLHDKVFISNEENIDYVSHNSLFFYLKGLSFKSSLL